ncbi:MAG: glycosyltransferase [Solirubrobacterales bacterium]|nr:glycosyltransferase [Solirubrobacterales bacterium]
MPHGSPRSRVVAVGQTPPPLGGQAVAIESFVTGRYRSLEVFHVRMAFSTQTAEIGKPRLKKMRHLVSLVTRVLWCRVRSGASILYYPPAGPELVPVVRDMVVLLCTRWAFGSTVLHFHASGVSEIEPRLARPLRILFRSAYGGAELAIQTSALNPPDGQRLGARRVAVIANGVPDHPLARRHREDRSADSPVVLYAGVVRESKGLLVLVEACRRLLSRGLDFRLQLMGSFESRRFESTLRRALADAGLAERTTLLGSLSGDAKAECFSASDIFCYPTHFEAESFGIVVIEAMQFSLPVVATHWRGIPSVVADGESGTLVPTRDPSPLAAALAMLVEDPDLRRRMGRRGRELYLERFTEDRFRHDMESVLSEL